ncbi:MAG: tetratricopeptide repeat protein, partial [Bacteroidota bacterium]
QYEYSCSLNALFGSAYFSVGELEKAVYRYKKAFELSLNTDYNFWKVKYANLTGQILKDLRRHKESIEFLLKLLPLAKEYGINTYTYKTLISLGYRYMYLGDFQNSIIYFNKAIDYSKNESILRRANAYTSIGEAYYKFGKETEAKKAYRQAKEMFNSDDLSLKSFVDSVLFYESMITIDS